MTTMLSAKKHVYSLTGIKGEAACTYTRGRRGGRDTLAAVVYQRVVSKHGSLAGGNSWKVTVEDYKQEWTKNGSLGNS